MLQIRNYTFATVFLLIIVGFGTLSFEKLVNFYINQEKDYNEWTPKLGTKFETDIASTFYNKVEFVNFNGAVANILSQPKMNGVVKLNNGYLFVPFAYTSDKTLQAYADSTIRFNEYLKNRGTVLLYASTPYTSSKYNLQLPTGIADYGNDNIDRFLEMIRTAGVETVDFRATMYENGIDQYDMMYRTDHHWTTKAGLYAYGILSKIIADKLGCKVDERVADIDYYTVTTYEKWHLGSRGQRTGIYYAGIDDFDLIIPNFKTTLKNGAGQLGSMQDLMINMEPLANKDYTSRYTYDHVMGGALGHYFNLDCKNGIKILAITDSFGRVLNPYLAMGFHEVKYVYDGDVSEVSPDFIESYASDVVIMMYYPDCLLEGRKAFLFNGF